MTETTASQPISARPSGAPGASGPSRAAMAFILAVVVLDLLAIGMIVPVLVPLVKTYFGGDEAEAAHAFGLVMTLWAVAQFFASPILGALSDRFGRRPIIIISCLGLGLSFFATALAPTFALFVASRLISGFTAGNMSAANAYVADTVPPDQRAKAFGWMGAAFGVGFSLGPAMGGLLGEIDVRLPFYVAGVLCLANALFGLFVLPESLKPANRSAFSWRKANPVGALAIFNGQTSLYTLLIVYFLFSLGQQVFPSAFVLYSQHRYGFSTGLVGATMAASAVISILGQLFLVQRVVKRVGESRSIVIGLAGGAAGLAAYGLAPTAVWFWASMPIMILWAVFMPAIQSTLTRRASPDSQGRLQGGLSSLMSVSGVIAPGMFTGVFALGVTKDANGVEILPGAPFLLGALCLATGALIAWRATQSVGAIGAPRR